MADLTNSEDGRGRASGSAIKTDAADGRAGAGTGTGGIRSSNYLFLIIGIPLIAFVVKAAPALQARSHMPLMNIVNGATGLLLQAVPFVLIGVLVSAAVETWVSADFIERHFPRSTVAGFAVALVAGLCMPVCDCIVVPTFARLVRRRLPLPCAVTFLCAVPVMNPVAVWSTWFAFSDKPWMVVARVGLGMLVALLVGLSFLLVPMRSEVVRPEPRQGSDGVRGITACAACAAATDGVSDAGDPRSAPPAACAGPMPATGEHRTPAATLPLYIRHVHDDFLQLMPIILFGILVASSIRTALGTDPASAINATTLAAAIAVMMGIAYISSICSTSDAVIARSLATAFPTSALLGFLLFGPMLDFKNTLMLITQCRNRFTIRIALTITVTCFAVACVSHWFLLGASA